jgi:sigma-E factor negative regulatory protein RseC
LKEEMIAIERVGTVIEVKDETAVVKMQRHLSCENCGRCGGILGKEDQRDHIVEVPNPLKAAVGQRVYIETDDRQAIFVSFMLYMVPLFALIAGILGWLQLAPLLGFQGSQELPAVGVGFGLLALVFVGIRLWDRRVKETGRYRPGISGLVEEDGGENDESNKNE